MATIVLVLVASAGASAQPVKGDGPTTLAAGLGAAWVGTGRGELFRVDAHNGRVRKVVAKQPGQIGYVAGLAVAHGAVWLSDAALGIARLDPSRRRPPTSVFPAQGPLSATPQSVWAVNPWRDEILRINPARLRIVARIAMPGRLWAMAAGHAGVFVVHGPATDGPTFGPAGEGVLQRVDLRTNRVTGPAVLLPCGVSMVVGRDAVWTTDACTGRLDRREARSLRSTASVDLASDRRVVLAAFGSIWLIGGGEVVRVDQASMRVVAAIPVRASIAAADRTSLWLLELGDGRTGFLRRLAPRTNRVVGHALRLPP